VNNIKTKFGSNLTELLQEINKIKNESISDFQVHKHNNMVSTSSDLKKFKDLFNCYEKGFKSCENVCKERNIFEPMNYGSFNMLMRYNKWIVDDKNEEEGERKAKIALGQGFQENIEEWFLMFIEALKQQILEKYTSTYEMTPPPPKSNS
jgi:succinate dehydrogenase/fumarate reductase-like Fe-S protein